MTDEKLAHYDRADMTWVNPDRFPLLGTQSERLVCPECLLHKQGARDMFNDCKHTYLTETGAQGQCECCAKEHGLRNQTARRFRYGALVLIMLLCGLLAASSWIGYFNACFNPSIKWINPEQPQIALEPPQPILEPLPIATNETKDLNACFASNMARGLPASLGC